MSRISDHVSLAEAIKSATAKRKGIDNTPTADAKVRMTNVAEKVFEPLRTHFNVPIYISSFYRSEKLNKAVNGSKTSQHVKGEAMDLDADVFGGITNKQIFDYIKNNLEYDQLIWEYGNATNPSWVHVSLKLCGKNRKQIIKIV